MINRKNLWKKTISLLCAIAICVSVILAGVPAKAAVGSTEPSWPTDFTELHWTDFEGLNYQEYINPSPDGAKGTYGKSLNKTLLSGELVMGANTDIRYAGTGWSGLLLCADMWGNLVIESSTFATKYEKVLAAADYGLTSFAGNQFGLKISTKIDGSKYTFGIWVNDKYVDTFTLEANEGTAAGSALGLYGRGSGNITLVKTQPDVPPTEEVPTDYTELHWTDFEGLNHQEYINPSPDGAKGTYSKSLNKTLLSGELVMGANTDIRYAGTGWSGLLLCADMWGNLVIDSSTFATKYEKVLAAADYGLTSFAGNQFGLKISTKIDGSKYTFGIWVNDKYVDTFTLEANEGTAAGSALGLYGRGSGNITLVKTQPDVPPIGPIQPPTDFTVITLDDFGGTIRPGTLTSGDVIAGELTTVSSYDRTLFNVNVNMITDSPGDATYIRFGGTSDGWVGIGFESRPNGTIELWDWQHGSVLQVYTKDKAGVDFFKKDFDLKISFEFIDSDNDENKDDLQMGVYFNNVLYNNELVVARDFEMTKFLLARTDDAELHPLELKVVRDDNEVAIRPDKSLKEISFSSFGIEDAVFDDIDVSRLCATGSYYDIEEGNTLDGTLFHGVVKFSKVGSCELRFGGLISPWTGIRIMGASDGNIYVLDAEGDAPEKQYSYILNPYDAGCQLVGKWLDLKISTQFVDVDGDGKKDDVQLGFWFNDVLYKNEYIVLMNYRKNMGSYLSIYCFDANTDIAIKSVELNNTISLDIFGLDDNFKKQFASTGKDPVVGEPLGVTQEYETADYHLDMTREAMEVEKPGGDSTVHQSVKLRYVILAAIGSVCLAGIIVWLILFVKKRKNRRRCI